MDNRAARLAYYWNQLATPLADAERPTHPTHPTHPTLAEIQDQAQEALERGRSKVAAEALRRGEQVHREMEIALGKQLTLAEMLSRYEDAVPFRWHPATGRLVFLTQGQHWQPGRCEPPGWVPKVLSDAWYAEGAEVAPLASDGAIDWLFDEPEGECRKSAESATKPRLELVPYECVEEIAEVLTFGAAKYEANNWARGARWGRYFAALLRHAFAWWRGEDRDPETGFSHLAHAGCCLFFLMAYQRHGWGKDDRFLSPDNKPFTKHDGAR